MIHTMSLRSFFKDPPIHFAVKAYGEVESSHHGVAFEERN
jgi:hypothetical protein